MRLLLVEDNRALCEWLAKTLRQQRYVVECAFDGEDAAERLRLGGYDMVILDLELPRLEGEEVLRRLRRHDADTPVIILTAKNTLTGRVESLNSGADDYMVKPFEVEELEARIRVLMRRTANHKSPHITCGSLSYDTNTRLFAISGQLLALTPREHALLEALTMRRGRTVSKSVLVDALYTLSDEASPDAIEVYVHRLRRKMEGCDAAIVTLRGLGYMLTHAKA